MVRRLLLFALLTSAVARAEDAKPDELSLSTRVAHVLSVSDAHVRIQQMLEYWHQRFGIESKWDGDCATVTGKVYGVDFRARFDVLDGAVNAEATDPGPFLRGRITDYTVKKLKKYLSPNYSEP
jgi:hypothetical protein